MRKLSFLSALSAVLLTSTGVYAQAGNQAVTYSPAVQELYKIVTPENTTETLMAGVVVNFQQTLPQYTEMNLVKPLEQDPRYKKLTAVQIDQIKALINQFLTKCLDTFRTRLVATVPVKKALEESTMSLYASYLNDAEIAELVKFYKTPLGKKVLEFGPKIATESQQRFLQKVSPQIDVIIRDIVEKEWGSTRTQIETVWGPAAGSVGGLNTGGGIAGMGK